MKARSRRRCLYRPRYLRLHDSGQLPARVEALVKGLENCRICPRACSVNRLAEETGFCGTGRWARVAKSCLHRGEEPPLCGTRGSGTIFIAGCNLRCIYCQNHQISQVSCSDFPQFSSEDLAREMLALQRKGAHNINFVSPSHVFPQLAEALWLAAQQGLQIPVICNSNGYESLGALRGFEGFVDIYLPDFKYVSSETGSELSGAADYPSVALAGIEEMYRQVGPLRIDESGLAYSGLLVRHLILPGRVEESLSALEELVRCLGTDISVSLMAQYFPAHNARQYRGLDRTLSVKEYQAVVEKAATLGIGDLWTQETGSAWHYCPDFGQPHPFEF